MFEDAVDTLRRFNRSYTPRVGVLDDSFLDTGRPLAAARLLFEIGLGPVTVHELRRRTGADSGYVSRLLRNLEGDGLVEMRIDPADRRRRVATLTSDGETAWNELDQRSDEIARRLLSPLSDHQHQQLVKALDTVDRLLRAASIELRSADPADPVSIAAMTSYVEELSERFPGGFDIGTGFEPDELDPMTAPAGEFVIAVAHGDVVGCGGLRPLPDGSAEIKRMWVSREVRGLGLGRRLLEPLEGAAAERGYAVVVLDTNGTLDEAISMYRRAGYEEVGRYNDNPYAELFFSKRISG